MEGFVLTAMLAQTQAVEVVERKGAGHPDSICDALAEQLSRDLCAAYRAQFGAILHHNVDKALLSAGRARATFGGGRVEAPIEIYLGGRATAEVAGKTVPVADLAVEGARRWLRSHLHALDVDRHVRIHPLLHPGSQDLQGLFARGATAMPRANDTSIGVGYAPLSPLEQLVLAVDRMLAAEIARNPWSPWGEDIKIMAVRTGSAVQLTISCAFVGRYLPDLEAYLGEKAAVARLAAETAHAFGFPSCRVTVNAADQAQDGQVYLTVTGTSAEAGDDGQVGRGNRINGLITPGRPMSLEAAAGKNPVSHVGKIYNVAAREIAAQVVAKWPEALRAECLLVSQIGAPIDEPSVAEVRIEWADGRARDELWPQIAAVAEDVLASLPARIDQYLTGAVELY
jgi:S-adenosylmethionine synthetase